MSLGDDAYHAGREAHDAGVRLKDNPFKGKSQEEHWKQGWLWARAFKKAAPKK